MKYVILMNSHFTQSLYPHKRSLFPFKQAMQTRKKSLQTQLKKKKTHGNKSSVCWDHSFLNYWNNDEPLT